MANTVVSRTPEASLQICRARFVTFISGYVGWQHCKDQQKRHLVNPFACIVHEPRLRRMHSCGPPSHSTQWQHDLHAQPWASMLLTTHQSASNVQLESSCSCCILPANEGKARQAWSDINKLDDKNFWFHVTCLHIDCKIVAKPVLQWLPEIRPPCADMGAHAEQIFNSPSCNHPVRRWQPTEVFASLPGN